MSKDIGITVTKNDNFSEWYTQVVLKAELADYAPVKGLIVLRPDGYSIWESIKSALDEKFKKVGIRNGFLPILIPESGADLNILALFWINVADSEARIERRGVIGILIIIH